MDADTAKLVEQARDLAFASNSPYESPLLLALADAVERLTAERIEAEIGESVALRAVEHHKRRANAAEVDRDRLAAALQNAKDKLPDPMHPAFPRRFVDAQVDALAIIDAALAAAAGKEES